MRVRMLLGCMALSLWLLSCADAGGGDDGVSMPRARGVVRLALTAADSAGVQYRLRNAEFEISGYPDGYYPGMWPDDDGGMSAGTGGRPGYPPGYVTVVVSSETDPEAEFITMKLIPGVYSIALRSDDWYLERATDGGEFERVERAVLLSPRYQSVYVWDGGVSYVDYTFGVDGELIDFRSGELQIGISIEKPGEHCPGGGFGGFGGRGGSGGACSGGFGAAGAGPIP